MTRRNFFMLGLSLFLCFILVGKSKAQDVINRNNADKRTLSQFDKARSFSDQKAFTKAVNQLDAILKKTPNFIDAILLKAAISYDTKNYEEAEILFGNAIELDPSYNRNIYYQLGVTQWQMKKYEACAENMDKFLQGKIKRKATINRAEKYRRNALFAAKAIKNPVPFQPEPLDENINTSEAMEMLPMTTADQFFLLYVKMDNRQEDLYISQSVNNTWQTGRPMNGFADPQINEGAPSISADGSTLIYTVCNRRGDYGSCDLYISDRIDINRWTRPQNIGTTINSPSWESQPSLSANGRVLYFSSDRKGGYGKRDIWKSIRADDGQWSVPENLGPVINTADNEEAPFLHPDEQTFYFMSDGHPGMGNSDLFLSRKDTSLKWGTPENLGYPINTEEREGGLFITLDGTTAYYTKRNGRDNDIYTFEFPPEKRPQAVTFIRANVVNALTEERLIAEVEIYDLNNNRLFNKIRTQSDGSFLTCLPLGTSYALSVEKEGFAFYSDNFSLEKQQDSGEPYFLNIPLIPLSVSIADTAKIDSTTEVSEPIVLKNIFFETGSAVLRSQSNTELNKLYQLLEDNSAVKIQILGHTDNVGNETDNLKLSEERAKSVYQYLLDKGIAQERIAYKGFGEDRPIADNDTTEGRQQNRRTEFVIVK